MSDEISPKPEETASRDNEMSPIDPATARQRMAELEQVIFQKNNALPRLGDHEAAKPHLYLPQLIEIDELTLEFNRYFAMVEHFSPHIIEGERRRLTDHLAHLKRLLPIYEDWERATTDDERAAVYRAWEKEDLTWKRSKRRDAQLEGRWHPATNSLIRSLQAEIERLAAKLGEPEPPEV